jgi:hypothetical protein
MTRRVVEHLLESCRDKSWMFDSTGPGWRRRSLVHCLFNRSAVPPSLWHLPIASGSSNTSHHLCKQPQSSLNPNQHYQIQCHPTLRRPNGVYHRLRQWRLKKAVTIFPLPSHHQQARKWTTKRKTHTPQVFQDRLLPYLLRSSKQQGRKVRIMPTVRFAMRSPTQKLRR